MRGWDVRQGSREQIILPQERTVCTALTGTIVRFSALLTRAVDPLMRVRRTLRVIALVAVVACSPWLGSGSGVATKRGTATPITASSDYSSSPERMLARRPETSFVPSRRSTPRNFANPRSKWQIK